MINPKLEFDFSNIRNGIIYKKNYLFKMILSIIIFSLFLILITFLFLYLLHVNMNFNGVERHFDDPIYQNFFMSFFKFFVFSILILLMLFITNIFQKKKPYIIIDCDTNLNIIYYIYDYSNKKEIYISDELTLIYDFRFDYLESFKDTDKINDIKEKYIFWHNFNKIKIDKLKIKNNKTILKFHDKISNRFLNIHKKYTFSNFIQKIPTKILELIFIRSGSSDRIQSVLVYYLENINQRIEYSIHPKIKNSLSLI